MQDHGFVLYTPPNMTGGEGIRSGVMGIALVVGLTGTACGARDVGERPERGVALTVQDGGERHECLEDDDCPTSDACFPRACDDGRCVDGAPVVCDDGDSCTIDSCDPNTAECHFTPTTLDSDGDGYRAPLTGFVAGAVGACGNDCDDNAANAYPGGIETCDGLDNDCNGIIDDGYSFRKTTTSRLLVADGEKGAESGGVVFAEDQYAFFVSTHDAHYQAQLIGIDPIRGERFRSDVSLTNSDTFAGDVEWTGQVLALVWEDRRDNDYEIYFNRFDTMGQKLDPDLRVSNAPGFSLDPTLYFSGSDYFVLWSDGRRGSNDFRVFGQRIGLLGALQGNGVDLTPEFSGARAPSVTGGETEIGMAFNAPLDEKSHVVFRTLNYDLSIFGEPTVVSQPNASGASVVYASGRYLVFWGEYDSGPGESIWGAVVDSRGEVLVPGRALTPGGGFARSYSALSLGDRILLAWANDWGASYDIYLQTFSLQLQPLDEVQQATFSDLDVLAPRLRIAADGVVGLSYTERSVENGPRVWLETLSCK